MAGLLAKETGYCRGRSGSMHIADVATGNLGANGIVAGGVPIATGAALAARMRGEPAVAVSSFGDGAVNEGAWHEGVNEPGVDLGSSGGVRVREQPLRDVDGRRQGIPRSAAVRSCRRIRDPWIYSGRKRCAGRASGSQRCGGSCPGRWRPFADRSHHLSLEGSLQKRQEPLPHARCWRRRSPLSCGRNPRSMPCGQTRDVSGWTMFRCPWPWTPTVGYWHPWSAIPTWCPRANWTSACVTSCGVLARESLWSTSCRRPRRRCPTSEPLAWMPSTRCSLRPRPPRSHWDGSVLVWRRWSAGSRSARLARSGSRSITASPTAPTPPAPCRRCKMCSTSHNDSWRHNPRRLDIPAWENRRLRWLTSR
jgi:hypothetical protein